MGRKDEGAAVPLPREELHGSPSNTMWPGLRSTSVLTTKWHLHPSSRLATIDMGRKLGGGLRPFLVEGAESLPLLLFKNNKQGCPCVFCNCYSYFVSRHHGMWRLKQSLMYRVAQKLKPLGLCLTVHTLTMPESICRISGTVAHYNVVLFRTLLLTLH